ncbi:MAG: bifunctional riboflavin kinase/FMN adenylyltransferase [Oligoflexales bacterium]|nr:bifunctional riboflavin kinase/FMN adenylyltransferase [Oligoflexales bacterium]
MVSTYSKIHLLNASSTGLPKKNCALTLGNFDACHLGHQALIQKTLDWAGQLGIEARALTFDPLPEEFFGSRQEGFRLLTRSQKVRAFKELGILQPIIQDFDEQFSLLSPEEFFVSVLVKALRARALVVGANFCFGYKREGNAEWLRKRAEQEGLAVSIIPTLRSQDGEAISSSRIRELLTGSGEVELCSQLLGRPYLVEGRIVTGDSWGKKLGFPTANLEVGEQILPKAGVYAGYTWIAPEGPQVVESSSQNPAQKLDLLPAVTSLPTNQQRLPSVFSIGGRPSMEGHSPRAADLRVEAHFLDFSSPSPDFHLGGKLAGYYLTHRLRDMEKFSSLEDLKHAIRQDVQKASSLLKTGSK